MYNEDIETRECTIQKLLETRRQYFDYWQDLPVDKTVYSFEKTLRAKVCLSVNPDREAFLRIPKGQGWGFMDVRNVPVIKRRGHWYLTSEGLYYLTGKISPT